MRHVEKENAFVEIMGFIGEFGFEFPGNRKGEAVKISHFNSMGGKLLLVETNSIH